MLSQTVEYALRLVVCLALPRDAPAKTQELAQATRVPPAYLAKVIQKLARANIVKSRRGVGGGVALCRPPDELTILEVVSAVEPITRIATCPLGLAAHGVQLCPLHSRVDQALAMLEEAFRATTLAEIIETPRPATPACPFPSVGKRRSKSPRGN